MQTSIEKLVYSLLYNNLVDNSPNSKFWEIIEEAKEMHRKEVITTYNDALEQCKNFLEDDIYRIKVHIGLIEEHYYNKQFGVKQTPILEWEKFDKCSVRLRNILGCICKGGVYSKYKEEFIENISLKEMAKIRNCGSATIKEFVKLRGY